MTGCIFCKGVYTVGFLDFFAKRDGQQPPAAVQPFNAPLDLELCANMRVEVTALDGRILFVAKLMYPRGSTAELHQYSESDLATAPEEPIAVRIRGYNDHEKKAVYLEGLISSQPKHIWRVEDLKVARTGNDRAFFRLETNIDATVNKLSGRNSGEKPCKLLNISIGGARLSSAYEYWEGDKLLLTVKLMEDREPSIMYCQILRVISQENSKYEYGCQFLELNEMDQEKITQNIFAVQRKQRGRVS